MWGPERAELPDVNTNKGLQSINTGRALTDQLSLKQELIMLIMHV